MLQPTLVSLVIPSYKSSWFEEALLCTLNQDYPHIEIIVSDDCPTNDIQKIVSKHKVKSPFPLRYIHNTPSLGDIRNFEACVNLAQGEFIKFLCDDDLIAPNCISKLVDAIQCHPSIRIATSQRHLIGIRGEKLPETVATASLVEVDSVINGRDVNSYQLHEILNFIGEPSTVLMYREDLLDMMGQPDGMVSLNGEIMYFLGDLVMYIKILANANLAYIAEPLSSLRISRQQVSQLGRLNDERALRSHKRFPELIRELDLGDDHSLPAKHLRIAPLSSPEEFEVVTISERLEVNVKESLLANWLNQRRLLPVQRELLEKHINSFEAVTLTILLDARGEDVANINKTLSSLSEHTLPGLNLNSVVLTDIAIAGIQTLPASTSPADALNALAQHDPNAWYLTLTAGWTFLPSGLISLASTLLTASSLLAIYGDEVHTIDGKVIGARFRPDFSLDQFLSQPGTMTRNWLWRGEAITTFGMDSHAGSAFEFDLLVKLIENQGGVPIGHLAEPLFIAGETVIAGDEEERILLRHLANRGYPNAGVTRDIYGHFHIQYGHDATPMVSVIIAAVGNSLAPLVTCVTTIIEKSQWHPYELLVIADDGAPEEVRQWLMGLSEIDPGRIKVLQADGKNSRTALINAASSVVLGQYLLLLHPDIVITQPLKNRNGIHMSCWLLQMMVHLKRYASGLWDFRKSILGGSRFCRLMVKIAVQR